MNDSLQDSIDNLCRKIASAEQSAMEKLKKDGDSAELTGVEKLAICRAAGVPCSTKNENNVLRYSTDVKCNVFVRDGQFFVVTGD